MLLKSVPSNLLRPLGSTLLSLVAFFSGLLHYDYSSAQSKYLVNNFWVENYSKKEGLPESIIIDILQDKRGYMWMTTPYNLVRFDGYEFKTFSPRKDFPNLYIHFFSGLVEDSRGLIWMDTFEMGVFCFDPQTGKFIRYYAEDKSNQLTSNNTQGIAEDKYGNIWIATPKGLNCISGIGKKVTVKQYAGMKPEPLLKFLDGVFASNTPISSISKVGDFAHEQRELELKEPSKILVVCEGESFELSADYGWIENSAGKQIWKAEDPKALAAGGDSKNRVAVEVVSLPAGKYKVFYKTDDSHSWNKWNAEQPTRPDWWGINLFQLPAPKIDSIQAIKGRILNSGGIVNDNIRTLLADNDKTIWALTYAGLEKISVPATPGGPIHSEKIPLPLGFASSNNFKLYGRDSLLVDGYLFDSITQKSNTASFLLSLSTKKGILIDDGEVLATSVNPDAFLKDRMGRYWKGTFDNNGNGLYISDQDYLSPRFRKLNIIPPGSSKGNFEQIWAVYEDHMGYVWIGSRQTGLYKIKEEKPPIRFIDLAASVNLTEISFSDIVSDVSGDMWAFSRDNGLFWYHKKTGQITHFTTPAKQPVLSLFHNPRNNSAIVTASSELKEFRDSSTGFKSLPVYVPDSLNAVAADANGNFWAERNNTSDPNHAIYVFDGHQFQPVSFDSSKFTVGFYRCVFWGNRNNVWISPGFEGVQLYRYDTSTKKLSFVKRWLPEGTDVYDIYEDPQGIVWCGTYDNGLIRLDPAKDTYTSFTRKDGMPSNFVHKLLRVGNKIWAISDLGSVFLDMQKLTLSSNKELDEFITQNTNNTFFTDFDRWYHKRITVTSTGDIAYLAKNGFCFFSADRFPADTITPVLQMASLHIGKKAFDLGALENANIRLGHSENDLVIEYIGIHYDRSGQSKYAYLLKGANDDWVNAGTERVARYSNLSPGRYEFYLKAANADGIWSKPQKMFTITILPPWWKTWWAYTLYVLIIGFSVWAFIRYRSRKLKKENINLEEKVTLRTNELSASINELKETQSQLVQREKMASLGELTAGIAHEIQNPLNFVNNFSEVNAELIDELEGLIDKKNGHEEEEKAITKDLKENEQKIIFHGKRADAIVKSMLQHSRSSTGKKEPTEINPLADEYLRLAYHGIRAKDKSFNATIKTDFDPAAGKINIISQDVGRVILNLITNAFYAVNQRKKAVTAEGRTDYEPTVNVSTKRKGNIMEISVKDNGTGVPQKVLDKIFQPFFTTKPVGEGTGLGLSLSYEIITKAHGGELKVNTKEGEGSEFIIDLPV